LRGVEVRRRRTTRYTGQDYEQNQNGLSHSGEYRGGGTVVLTRNGPCDKANTTDWSGSSNESPALWTAMCTGCTSRAQTDGRQRVLTLDGEMARNLDRNACRPKDPTSVVRRTAMPMRPADGRVSPCGR